LGKGEREENGTCPMDQCDCGTGGWGVSVKFCGETKGIQKGLVLERGLHKRVWQNMQRKEGRRNETGSSLPKNR